MVERGDLPLLAQRVRARQDELGLTDERVVERMPPQARISLSAYRLIKHGTTTSPTRKTIDAVAAALEVPATLMRRWVIGEDDDPTPAVETVAQIGADTVLMLTDRLAQLEAAAGFAAAPPQEQKAADESAVMVIFDCLTDEQRRVTLRAVGRWVRSNKEYAVELGGA